MELVATFLQFAGILLTCFGGILLLSRQYSVQEPEVFFFNPWSIFHFLRHHWEQANHPLMLKAVGILLILFARNWLW